MQRYPRRDPVCHRLIRRESLENHPGWPGPQDPPTGTPKNGRRTSKKRHINYDATQLPTPPETQKGARTDEIDRDGQCYGGDSSPATPTPCEQLTSNRRVSVSSVFGIPCLSTPPRTSLHFDAIDDLFLDEEMDEDNSASQPPSPIAPSPFTVNNPSRSRSAASSSAPASAIMHATPTRASATPATPSTILVPETPLTAAGNRTIATHYGPRNATAQPQSQAPARRTQTRTHQPPTTPQLNPSLSNPRTELQHLRTRRADLTDRLNESTSHISRLQLRQRLQAHELLRERAVAGRATADRKVLEAGRDEGVTAAIAEARERAMRQGIVNGRLRALLIILFLAVAGYAAWCYVNQASFRYIRGVEERRYGL